MTSNTSATTIFLFVVGVLHLSSAQSIPRVHLSASFNELTISRTKLSYLSQVLDMPRGGRRSYDYSEGGDSYDDAYDICPPSKNLRRSRPSQSTRSNRHTISTTRRNATSRPHSHRSHSPPNSRTSSCNKRPSLTEKTASIAKKSINLATAATLSTMKGTGKAAYYLASPKYVRRDSIYGVWRLDQVIVHPANLRRSRHEHSYGNEEAISCAANFELTPKGEVITKYDSSEHKTIYLFASRKWPRSCTIDFEARAFQGPDDTEPLLYSYKGYFRKKMADPRVIKIVGKIYHVNQSKGRFWDQGDDNILGRRDVEVGSFVARRRIKPTIINDYNFENSEAYDIYNEYDEEDLDFQHEDDELYFSE